MADLVPGPRAELRSIFLGDPTDITGGLVELVEFPAGIDDGDADVGPPSVGFFLLSVYLDVGPTLERLASLGFDEEVRRITLVQGVEMAVVHDPNGVRVELIGLGAATDPLAAQ